MHSLVPFPHPQPANAVPDGSTLSIIAASDSDTGSDGLIGLGKQVEITVTDSYGTPLTDFSAHPLQLCLTYDNDELAAVGGNSDDLIISYFNPAEGAWEELTTGRIVDTDAHLRQDRALESSSFL